MGRRRDAAAYDAEGPETEVMRRSAEPALSPIPGYMQRTDAPSPRRTGLIIMTSVLISLLVIAVVGGAGLLYYNEVTENSDLREERNSLRSQQETLSSQLADMRLKLRATDVKLSKASKGLNLAKRNLTKMRKDLVSANETAETNYSAGYTAGQSAGYNEGESAGYSSGLTDASDALTCSDDPDVTWLPYCNP